MQTMRLNEFHHYCKDLLFMDDFVAIDPSQNGIQVERQEQELKKLVFAVDASLQTFRQAAEMGADLIFVHHGIFWGHESVLTGAHYQRIRFLLEHDMALYAVHLPLDAHAELGNNSRMAAALGIPAPEPFGWYKGRSIGFKGTLPDSVDLDEVLRRLGIDSEDCNAVLPFGAPDIRSVGIISGGSSRDIRQAIDENLDLFISGEGDHTIYHEAQENRINMLAVGHYASETWGVSAMAEQVARDTGLETHFIDIPTGL
jgi:dinuclear metal center YbgI/SA1388 family protein